MSVFGARTANAFGRAACAVTLLFLFFLPLHVHVSLSPQLSNQCSCLLGARAHFIIADEAPTVVPVPQFGVLLEPPVCAWSSTTSLCQYVRGPPLSLAV
jgi:hypothetical protein